MSTWVFHCHINLSEDMCITEIYHHKFIARMWLCFCCNMYPSWTWGVRSFWRCLICLKLYQGTDKKIIRDESFPERWVYLMLGLLNAIDFQCKRQEINDTSLVYLVCNIRWWHMILHNIIHVAGLNLHQYLVSQLTEINMVKRYCLYSLCILCFK